LIRRKRGFGLELGVYLSFFLPSVQEEDRSGREG